MATQTSNLQLVKPALDDDALITDINGNMDKIDQYAGTTNTAIATLNSNINKWGPFDGTSKDWIRSGDLNDYKTPGVYPIGSGVTNLPSNTYAWGILEVFATRQDTVEQKYYYGTHIWVRELRSGTWSAWEELALNSDITNPFNGAKTELSSILDNEITVGMVQYNPNTSNIPTANTYGICFIVSTNRSDDNNKWIWQIAYNTLDYKNVYIRHMRSVYAWTSWYSLYDNVANVQNGLAYIVGNTNTTGSTLDVGQFVYVKGHSTIAEGLRKVTASISANGSITTSNTSACSEGGLNALNSKITNSDMTTLSANGLTCNYIVRSGFCYVKISGTPDTTNNITFTVPKAFMGAYVTCGQWGSTSNQIQVYIDHNTTTLTVRYHNANTMNVTLCYPVEG